YPNMPVFSIGLAAALVARGCLTEARIEFERLAAGDTFAALPHDHTRVVGLAMSAVVCHALDDADRAGTLYELLRPHAEHFVRAARVAGGCLGSVAHYLG